MIHIGNAQFNASLIAFDKDGTLFDLHAQWAPWVAHMLDNIRQILNTDNGTMQRISASLGFDAQRRRILPDSPLATAGREELLTIIACVLYQEKLPWVQAWDTSRRLEIGFKEVRWIRPRADLFKLMSRLQNAGIKIAIITTDSRSQTETALQSLDLTDLVDCLICADDGIQIKPAPDMLLHAYHLTDTRPERCIVVGDTIYDMLMADRAGAGLKIGIAGGGGSPITLKEHADIVINSLDEIQPS